MQIPGEVFFLMNGWMDFLCLMLAAGIGKRRLPPGRGMVAALFGALYSLIALAAGPWASGWAALVISAQIMGCIAFGRSLPWCGAAIVAAGLILHGAMDFLLQRGWHGLTALGGVSLLAIGMGLLLNRLHPRGRGEYALHIRWQGRKAHFPAFRDSGNLLRDSITGLPVVLLSVKAAKALLPPRANPNDLSTLPAGWRLIRMETAAGCRTVMCLHPHEMIITRGKRAWHTDGLVALSEFSECRALLPDALFMDEKEEYHASI